jgi:hypothetical protein
MQNCFVEIRSEFGTIGFASHQKLDPHSKIVLIVGARNSGDEIEGILCHALLHMTTEFANSSFGSMKIYRKLAAIASLKMDRFSCGM